MCCLLKFFIIKKITCDLQTQNLIAIKVVRKWDCAFFVPKNIGKTQFYNLKKHKINLDKKFNPQCIQMIWDLRNFLMTLLSSLKTI